MSSIDLNSLLVKHGLLHHSFAFNDLPVTIKDRLGNENQARFQDCYLSLFANFGSRFWTESAKVTSEILHLAGLTNGAELLYPGTRPAPLILLGELANWSTPSPLGLGLHARYGPWVAYRALVKTTSPLQIHDATTEIDNTGNHRSFYSATSPCIRCESKACVSACPGNAVSVTASFDIGQCANYRIKENSNCKEKCHARTACPVGAEFRYSDEQQAYHMRHALQALVKWSNNA